MKKTIISSIVAASIVGVASYAPATNAANDTQCVDGSVRSNISVTWNSLDNVTVGTKNNAPLCDDTKLYFSSYLVPDEYDGKGFSNNPTASPQTLHDSASFTLSKNATGPTTISIDVPEACESLQVDVYYPQEISYVTAAGHGKQYISGKIVQKTVDECAPVTPEEPETPEEPVVNETPEAPVQEVPAEEAQVPEEGRVDAAGEGKNEAPQVIAATGAGSLLTLGAITSVLAYAGTYLGRK